MKASHAGFTLIEILLVTAVSGLLITVAIVGQHQLNARARFDSAIDKTIQNINYARNYGMSNVNEQGPGNTPSIEFAGESIEFENQNVATYGLTELEPIYASPDSNDNPDMSTLGNWPPGLPNPDPTCPAAQHPEGNWECSETFLDLPDDLHVFPQNDAEIFFIHSGNGLAVCHLINAGSTTIVQACNANAGQSFSFQLQDSNGYTATIAVDGQNGVASLQ